MASGKTSGRGGGAAPPGDGHFETGLRAWNRGDWLAARRLLRAAIESHPGKEARLEAGRILHALEPDRFALGLAFLFLLILATLFAWLTA